MPLPRPLLAALSLILATAGPLASAQATDSAGSTATSGSGASSGTGLRSGSPGGSTGLMDRYAGQRVFGLNLGQSNYQVGCGASLFECDDQDRYVHVYARGMNNDTFGAELGLVDAGRIDRGGGGTRAQGINLSLVGQTPETNGLRLYGKVGTTFGRTRVSSDPASPVASGRETGFGVSYGIGASYAITPQLSAVLALDSHDLRFPGGEREPVRATSLGLQYRY